MRVPTSHLLFGHSSKSSLSSYTFNVRVPNNALFPSNPFDITLETQKVEGLEMIHTMTPLGQGNSFQGLRSDSPEKAYLDGMPSAARFWYSGAVLEDAVKEGEGFPGPGELVKEVELYVLVDHDDYPNKILQ